MIIMDPIETIKPYKDTNFALLLAAQTLGFETYYCQYHQLFFKNNKVGAFLHPIRVQDTEHDYFVLEPSREMTLANMDLIFMRKDPPLDMRYIYCTQLLDLVRHETIVFNNPQALRDKNEKLFITEFLDCIPSTCVSHHSDVLTAFICEHQDVILKPLDGMGGQGIFRVTPQDPNIKTIIEMLTQQNTRWIMAQPYLSALETQGDKRVLMIAGQPVSYALARHPAKNQTRANIASGGHGDVVALTERDKWLAARIGPRLVQLGLHFVGIDIIGDYVTEINITAPTCVREIERVTEQAIARQVLEMALTSRSVNMSA